MVGKNGRDGHSSSVLGISSSFLSLTQKSEVLFFIQFHFDKGMSTREDPAVYAHSPFR